MNLSVVMITFNEEKRLRECLESVRFADEIVIVDSGSTDRTAEIAKEYSVRFTTRPFDNFSNQKNHALSQAAGDWVFVIDADERVPEDLKSEIRHICGAEKPENVYAVKRRTYFFQKPLRYSGTQGDAPIRLFPRGSARYQQSIHEEIVTALPVKRLRHELLHLTTESLKQFLKKLPTYMALEVETLEAKKRPVSIFDCVIRMGGRFLHRLIVQKGILDGWTGIQFAGLSAFYEFKKWSSYYKKVKKTRF